MSEDVAGLREQLDDALRYLGVMRVERDNAQARVERLKRDMVAIAEQRNEARAALATRAALSSPETTPAGVLDEAWAAAEKALRGHAVFELRVGVFAPGVSYWADGWHGDMEAGPRGTDMRGITTDGPTPAAALHALAAALGRSGSGGGRG